MDKPELFKKIILRSKLQEIEVKNITFELRDIYTSKFFDLTTLTYEAVKMPDTYLFLSKDIIEVINNKIDQVVKSTVRDIYAVVNLKIGDETLGYSKPRIFASDNVLNYIDRKIKSITSLDSINEKLKISNVSWRLDANQFGASLDIYFRTDFEYEPEFFTEPFQMGELKEFDPIFNLFEVFSDFQIYLHPQSN